MLRLISLENLKFKFLPSNIKDFCFQSQITTGSKDQSPQKLEFKVVHFAINSLTMTLEINRIVSSELIFAEFMMVVRFLAFRLRYQEMKQRNELAQVPTLGIKICRPRSRSNINY